MMKLHLGAFPLFCECRYFCLFQKAWGLSSFFGVSRGILTTTSSSPGGSSCPFGDTSYSILELGLHAQAQQVTLITLFHLDAVLHDPPTCT